MLAIEHVDVLSLDVEGAELTVLKSFDWDTVTIDTIVVENNWGDFEVYNYLKTLGFYRTQRVHIDDFYRHGRTCPYGKCNEIKVEFLRR